MYPFTLRANWWPAALTAFLTLAASQVNSAPNVLIIAPVGTNLQSSVLELVSFSTDGRKQIAELKGQVWYGTDEDSAVFLQIDGEHGKGDRLLVIDRKTLAVVTDKILDGVHSWFLKMPIGEMLAVRSKDSTVYFHSFEKTGDSTYHFGFSEANWMTGQVHSVPSTPPTGINDSSLMVLPSGFASVGFNGRIALYDETTRKELPMPTEDNGYNSLVNRRVYYVPTIGLMEYYKGMHRQVTDTHLSATITKPKEFPSSKMTTKIFVTDLNGKTYLIWGENKGPNSEQMPSAGVTEIVIVDPASGKEVLRRPLGGTFSGNIQPNRTGIRVYFIKSETGEIFCFDRETQSISSFAKTGLQHFNEWCSAIVAAD